jgi:Anti-sigma-K factor rskA, C-terminal
VTRSGADGSGAGGREGVRGSEPETGGRRRGPGRRRLVTALAGLAAGLIIGIGGTAAVIELTRAPAASVVAQIELSPLPQFPQWQGASGTAVMRMSGSQQQMVVTLNAPQRTGFYEVWLLARDGVSMISLGDLSADHTGTFTVPPGTDLQNYSRIDISLQPFNGSTVHVKTSVVRGSLPASAT